MKKMFIVSIIMLSLLTGCSGTAFEAYSTAVNNTEGAMYGKSKTDFQMEMDFNLEGLTRDEIRKVEPWKHFSYESTMTYNRELAQELVELYVKAYNLGIEGRIYKNKDRTILVSPILPKVVLLDGLDELMPDTSGGIDRGISEDSLEKLNKLWMKLLNNENRTSIGNIIISTPGGEIKSKEYIMNLGTEELRPVLKESMDILLQDDFIKRLGQENEHVNLMVIKDIDNIIDDIQVDSFSHRAFIDRDGFVAEETIEMDLDFTKLNNFMINKISINISIQNWDLGRKVEIAFPEINEDSIVRLNDILQHEEFNQFKGGLR